MLLVLILTVAAASGQAIDATPAMKADLERLVARAEKLNTLWPWQGPIPEVQPVVRHGKAVAPSLLALLADDPDDDTVDPVVNWRLARADASRDRNGNGIRDKVERAVSESRPRKCDARVVAQPPSSTRDTCSGS